VIACLYEFSKSTDTKYILLHNIDFLNFSVKAEAVVLWYSTCLACLRPRVQSLAPPPPTKRKASHEVCIKHESTYFIIYLCLSICEFLQWTFYNVGEILKILPKTLSPKLVWEKWGSMKDSLTLFTLLLSFVLQNQRLLGPLMMSSSLLWCLSYYYVLLSSPPPPSIHKLYML
jgi:hypothetical protein